VTQRRHAGRRPAPLSRHTARAVAFAPAVPRGFFAVSVRLIVSAHDGSAEPLSRRPARAVACAPAVPRGFFAARVRLIYQPTPPGTRNSARSGGRQPGRRLSLLVPPANRYYVRSPRCRVIYTPPPGLPTRPLGRSYRPSFTLPQDGRAFAAKAMGPQFPHSQAATPAGYFLACTWFSALVFPPEPPLSEAPSPLR